MCALGQEPIMGIEELKVVPPNIIELKRHESILGRKEIIAPPNFVSVFHETRTKFLPEIDQLGLKVNVGAKNIGEAETMVRRNKIFDQFRNEELKAKGISRNNIYAYPFLEYGHGLIGADQRFIKRDKKSLKQTFDEALAERRFFGNFLDYWKNLGVTTTDEYVRKMTDPDHLKKQYPGEIVELKVNPQICYIGDLEYITRIMDDIHRGYSENEAIQSNAEDYWRNLVTLQDFLKWYKKPEWTEDGNGIKNGDEYRDGEPCSNDGFLPIKGSPQNFPQLIRQPEILIPEDIPQEHIKLVK